MAASSSGNKAQNPDAEPGHSVTPPKVKAVMTSQTVLSILDIPAGSQLVERRKAGRRDSRPTGSGKLI
jgi:hypothetical protein